MNDEYPHLLAQSTGSFAEQVAAATPTPGGGSVAAYCAQLAASLGIMMCSLTIGKPKYAAAEARMVAIKQELERLSLEFRSLIDEDAASFGAVLAAYKHPKETQQQEDERKRLIQDALQRAANTPYHTAELSVEALNLLTELATSGNPNALSDVATGAQLANAATRGAGYNVLINLSSLTDQDAAGIMRSSISDLMARADTLAAQIEALLISQTS